MNLLQLSKRERFYFDVGEALSMNNNRCFIDRETMKVETYAGEDDYMLSDEEDSAQEALDNTERYLPVELVSSREAFSVVADFVETVDDPDMQQRLADALNGRKPFANFNHLVHTTKVREQWLTLKTGHTLKWQKNG